jgi:ligand-binding sensor domain-containing protein
VQGLYRLEEQNGRIAFRFIELGIATRVNSIIEDRRGALWIGSLNGLYRLVPGGRGERYTDRQGLLSNVIIHSLFEDREGRIWVGTREGGLFSIVSDPDPMRPVVARRYAERDGLGTKWINQIFQSSDGSLWAGSNLGLIRFIRTADDRDYRLRTYSEPQGLSYHEVESLAEDR